MDDGFVLPTVNNTYFIWLFHRGDHVVAVASLNYDPVVSQAADYMLTGKKMTKKQIQ